MNLRSIFAICFLSLPVPSRAQLGFGPEVGLGMSTMRFAPDQGYTSASTKSIFSIRAGGVIDKGFNKHIFFQSGLYFATKGQKRDFSFHVSDSLNNYVNQTLKMQYLDCPINLVYKTGHQGKGRLFWGIGATFSYLLAGKNEFHSQGKQNDTAFNVQFTGNLATGANAIPRFDLGINVFGGVELATGLNFKLYYTSGFQDLGPGTEIDKNKIYGIAVGYYFGKGRNINKEADDLIEKSDE